MLILILIRQEALETHLTEKPPIRLQ